MTAYLQRDRLAGEPLTLAMEVGKLLDDGRIEMDEAALELWLQTFGNRPATAPQHGCPGCGQ